LQTSRKHFSKFQALRNHFSSNFAKGFAAGFAAGSAQDRHHLGQTTELPGLQDTVLYLAHLA